MIRSKDESRDAAVSKYFPQFVTAVIDDLLGADMKPAQDMVADAERAFEFLADVYDKEKDAEYVSVVAQSFERIAHAMVRGGDLQHGFELYRWAANNYLSNGKPERGKLLAAYPLMDGRQIPHTVDIDRAVTNSERFFDENDIRYSKIPEIPEDTPLARPGE